MCFWFEEPQWLSSSADPSSARGLSGPLQKRSLHRGKHRSQVFLAYQLSGGKNFLIPGEKLLKWRVIALKFTFFSYEKVGEFYIFFLKKIVELKIQLFWKESRPLSGWPQNCCFVHFRHFLFKSGIQWQWQQIPATRKKSLPSTSMKQQTIWIHCHLNFMTSDSEARLLLRYFLSPFVSLIRVTFATIFIRKIFCFKI